MLCSVALKCIGAAPVFTCSADCLQQLHAAAPAGAHLPVTCFTAKAYRVPLWSKLVHMQFCSAQLQDPHGAAPASIHWEPILF